MNAAMRIGQQAQRASVVASVCLLAMLIPASAFAQGNLLAVPAPGTPASQTLPILKDVRIDQKLDSPVPLDLAFVDENGKDVTLGQYFGKKPVVLALVYYDCPMLCTLVLNGLTSSLETMNLECGSRFRSRRGQLQSGRAALTGQDFQEHDRQAIRPQGYRGWLPLLDRPRRPDQAAGGRRGLPLRVGSGDQPVRASGGDHDSHACGPCLAVSLRCRVRAS